MSEMDEKLLGLFPDAYAATIGATIAEADLPGSKKSVDELTALGWEYLDPPTWFSAEMWEYFQDVLGRGEYKILAMTKMPSRGVRGQFLISLQAKLNMKAHVAAAREGK